MESVSRESPRSSALPGVTQGDAGGTVTPGAAPHPAGSPGWEQSRAGWRGEPSGSGGLGVGRGLSRDPPAQVPLQSPPQPEALPTRGVIHLELLTGLIEELVITSP